MDLEKTISIQFFGKLNCVMYLKLENFYLQKIYNRIIDLYKPYDIDYSLFNLENCGLGKFDISIPFIDDNSIRKIIFSKNNESIILEYYKGKFIIEHLTNPQNQSFGEGIEMMRNLLNIQENIIIVLGFELSVDIDDFTSSLNATKVDTSLHPVIVLSKTEKKEFNIDKYVSINDTVNSKKLEFMFKYVDLLIK